MKKFLAVFDGYKMSTSTMQYSIELAKLEEAHLVGVFLDEFIYHSYSVYEVMTKEDRLSEIICNFIHINRIAGTTRLI